ncbi:MAG: hypothetical protein Q9191_008510 [Dirinaria sp. TL-2023a]
MAWWSRSTQYVKQELRYAIEIEVRSLEEEEERDYELAYRDLRSTRMVEEEVHGGKMDLERNYHRGYSDIHRAADQDRAYHDQERRRRQQQEHVYHDQQRRAYVHEQIYYNNQQNQRHRGDMQDRGSSSRTVRYEYYEYYEGYAERDEFGSRCVKEQERVWYEKEEERRYDQDPGSSGRRHYQGHRYGGFHHG